MPDTAVNGGVDWGLVMTMVIVVLVVLLILAIVGKLFKIALAIGAIIVLFPILTTTLWGDGATYVEKFASLFSPEIGTRIEQGYDYYREKDRENPIVDLDGVTDAATDIFNSAKDVVTNVFKGAVENGELAPEQSTKTK